MKTTPPKRQTIPAERTPCITYDKAPATVIPASERESRRGGAWTPVCTGVTTGVVAPKRGCSKLSGSRNPRTLAARLRRLGRRALDSRPRIGVRGKLHGNDGEDSLFQEIHRSFAKVSESRGVYRPLLQGSSIRAYAGVGGKKGVVSQRSWQYQHVYGTPQFQSY